MITLDKMQKQLDDISQAQGKLLAALNSIENKINVFAANQVQVCRGIDVLTTKLDAIRLAMITGMGDFLNKKAPEPTKKKRKTTS
jgi:hypothetical protein